MVYVACVKAVQLKFLHLQCDAFGSYVYPRVFNTAEPLLQVEFVSTSASFYLLCKGVSYKNISIWGMPL